MRSILSVITLALLASLATAQARPCSQLRVRGELLPGTTIGMHLSNSTPLQDTFLLIGFEEGRNHIILGRHGLLLGIKRITHVFYSGHTDRAGELTRQLRIPSGARLPRALVFQFLTVDRRALSSGSGTAFCVSNTAKL